MNFIFRFVDKPEIRHLGRWGISPDIVMKQFEDNTNIYDNSFTPYKVESDLRDCRHKKMSSTNLYYCKTCFGLRNQSEITELHGNYYPKYPKSCIQEYSEV